MTIVTVTKKSAIVLPMTTTLPMLSSQNTATPKTTRTVTHADLIFPSNTTVKHASGKSKYKK